MKAEMKQIEVWVQIDSGGDYAVASSEEDIQQAYDDPEATCPEDEGDATVKAQ